MGTVADMRWPWQTADQNLRYWTNDTLKRPARTVCGLY